MSHLSQIIADTTRILSDYISKHDASPTYLISGPLLQESAVARTDLSVGNVTNTQSLAHMSATQKLKIVDMDARSDAGSEADEEEVKAEESLENEPEDVVMEEKSEQVGYMAMAPADVRSRGGVSCSLGPMSWTRRRSSSLRNSSPFTSTLCRRRR